jgi:serine/threonine-protein kinase
VRDLTAEPGGVEIQAVIDRCLQKDRAQRFQNVAELARALAPFGPSRSEALVERIESTLGMSSGVPSSQAPPRVGHSVPVSPASMTLSPTTTAPPQRRSPLLVIAPLLVLIGAAAAVGVLVMKRSKESVVLPPTGIEVTSNVSSSSASPIAPVLALSEAPTTAPIVVESAAPQNPTHVHAHASSHASATAAPSASARCPTVSYFDASGVKHFKLECPP